MAGGRPRKIADSFEDDVKSYLEIDRRRQAAERKAQALAQQCDEMLIKILVVDANSPQEMAERLGITRENLMMRRLRLVRRGVTQPAGTRAA